MIQEIITQQRSKQNMRMSLEDQKKKKERKKAEKLKKGKRTEKKTKGLTNR